MSPLLRRIGIDLPIIQAPKAGVSTPEMAAAVSNAGGLGSVGAASVDAEVTRRMITAVRSRTDRPFNVNVFCHRPAATDPAREAAWLARLGPEFARYGAKPPTRLTEIYQSFLTDDAKLAVLVAERPTVVSFHFGLPARERMEALRAAGIVLLATTAACCQPATGASQSATEVPYESPRAVYPLPNSEEAPTPLRFALVTRRKQSIQAKSEEPR
jgi:nitronate monooxygenase